MKSVVDLVTKIKSYFVSNAAMGKLGAHNLIPMYLSNIKALNTTGNWSGNTYTVSNGTGTVVFAVGTNSNGDVNKVTVTTTTGRTGTVYFILAYKDFGDTGFNTATTPTANGYTISDGRSSLDSRLYAQYAASANVIRIAVNPSATANNLDLYPMIRLESDPNTEFEPYANTNLGLTNGVATVKSALTDKYLLISSNELKTTADGVKTNQALLKEAIDNFNTWLTAHPDYYVYIKGVGHGSIRFFAEPYSGFFTASNTPTNIRTSDVAVSTSSTVLRYLNLNTTLGSNEYNDSVNGTITSHTTEVPASGTNIRIYFDTYEKFT